jgi:hypothetical protein
MTALLVDDHSWIPDGFGGPAGLGPEYASADAKPGTAEVFGGPEDLLVCVERVVSLGESPPKVLVVRDQIACFDPTVIRVRDREGKAVFPEMGEPFDAAGSAKAVRAAEERGVTVRTGCVAGIREPGLLTPAERASLGLLGADAACGWLHLAVRRARASGTPVVGIGAGADLPPETILSILSDLV